MPKKSQAKKPPTSEEPSKLAAGVARMWRQVERARTDPLLFAELVMRQPNGGPFDIAPFHKEWMEALDKGQYVQIVGARRHAKSSLLVARCLFEIGRDPNLRIKIATSSDDLARKLLGEIKGIIERNAMFKMIFPNLKPSCGDWAKGRATVVRNSMAKDPSFEAAGIFSSNLGGRCDLAWFDDCVDLRNSVLFPKMQDDLKQKFLGEWAPTVEPRGRIWYTGTPWTSGDLTSDIQKSSEWVRVFTPVGTDDDPFKPIWPEVFDRERLMKIRRIIGPFEYDRAYRCRAFTGETAPVHPEWIRFYNRDMIGNEDKVRSYVCSIGVDLAISQASTADYFAVVVALYDPARNLIFIADAWHNRLTFGQQAEAIKDIGREWAPERIALEVGGYQGALAQYLQEHAEAPLPIVPVRPKGSKLRRLLEHTPLFEQGRVFFHPSLDPRQNLAVDDRGNLIAELLGFGQEKHDDLADAASYALAGLRDFFVQPGEDADGFSRGEGLDVRVSVVG